MKSTNSELRTILARDPVTPAGARATWPTSLRFDASSAYNTGGHQWFIHSPDAMENQRVLAAAMAEQLANSTMSAWADKPKVISCCLHSSTRSANVMSVM